jgi:hypothetical protein
LPHWRVHQSVHLRDGALQITGAPDVAPAGAAPAGAALAS